MKSLQDLIVKSLRERKRSVLFRIVGKYVKDEKNRTCYVFASDTKKPKPKPKQGTEKKH